VRVRGSRGRRASRSRRAHDAHRFRGNEIRRLGAPATVWPRVRGSLCWSLEIALGTSLALGDGMRAGFLSLLLLATAACSPAQRGAVGGAIGSGGLAVAGVAMDSMMTSSCRLRREGICIEYNDPLPPKMGFPLVCIGLGVASVGALILATSGEPVREPPKQAPPTPAPTDEPRTLGRTDAAGMALAHLVLVGLEGDAQPSKLSGVDDAQVSVRANDKHAELWDLRIRTVTDGSWRSVGACYEYEQEWRLTSLGTTPGCP